MCFIESIQKLTFPFVLEHLLVLQLCFDAFKECRRHEGDAEPVGTMEDGEKIDLILLVHVFD